MRDTTVAVKMKKGATNTNDQWVKDYTTANMKQYDNAPVSE